MTQCKHSELILLPRPQERLQCQHCHLTIKADELGENYCPECFEVHGKKHYNFKPVAEKNIPAAQYRCEQCGITIVCSD